VEEGEEGKEGEKEKGVSNLIYKARDLIVKAVSLTNNR